MRQAEEGIALAGRVDSLIVVPNDDSANCQSSTSVGEAFSMVDNVLLQGVKSISDLINIPGIINLDFADVKAIMEGAGTSLMGIGRAGGENRAKEAAYLAVSSPLLEIPFSGAKGVLFNVTGGPGLSIWDVNQVAEVITESASKKLISFWSNS